MTIDIPDLKKRLADYDLFSKEEVAYVLTLIDREFDLTPTTEVAAPSPKDALQEHRQKVLAQHKDLSRDDLPRATYFESGGCWEVMVLRDVKQIKDGNLCRIVDLKVLETRQQPGNMRPMPIGHVFQAAYQVEFSGYAGWRLVYPQV